MIRSSSSFPCHEPARSLYLKENCRRDVQWGQVLELSRDVGLGGCGERLSIFPPHCLEAKQGKKEKKKALLPVLGGNSPVLQGISCSQDLPGPRTPICTLLLATVPPPLNYLSLRRQRWISPGLPALQDVNEAFNHLVFLLLWLLFISVCRNQRNARAWKKAAIERLYLLFAPMMGN